MWSNLKITEHLQCSY